MHGAETVVYCVFVGSWCCPAMDSDVGHINGIWIWLETIFCWTWKEMNCASNTRHKKLSSKQKLLKAYFNSKSGCCPILRNLHDSTQYLILIEMMDAWESLRWPFPGCCFSSPREVARVVPALHSPRPRHYISHAPAAAGFRCSHERLTRSGAQRRLCIMNNGEMRCELVTTHRDNTARV